MPGLLDTNFDDVQNNGLLQFGLSMLSNSGPSSTPHSFGQIFGVSSQNALASMAAARKQKMLEDQAKMAVQLHGAQMQDLQSQMAERERKQKDAERLRNFYATQSSPMAGLQSAMGGNLAPTVANAAKMDALPQGGGMGQGGDLYSSRLAQAQALRAAGFRAEADAAEEHALKFKPKFATEFRQAMGADGKLHNYQVSEDGTIKEVALGVKPDMVEVNQGGFKTFQDKNAVLPGQRFDMTQTPDSIASNQVTMRGQNIGNANAAASRAQAENHFQLGLNSPQYMETANGVVALPKKLPPGQMPVGLPVMGPDGKQIEKPHNVPQYVVQGVIKNASALNSINAALSSLETPAGQSAVGAKAYLPNGLLNRIDPEGVNTRANISDIGSLVIHDRSGAAVTASESPRLMPFIPLSTDDPKTAATKLKRFREKLQEETNNLTFAHPKAKELAAQAIKSGAAAKASEIDDLINKYGGN